MEEEGIGARAVRALGTGFDVTSDFRLKFAKGYPCGARLVEIGAEREVRDVTAPGGELIRGVPCGVRCDKGERIRFQSDLLEFNKMSELLNQKSSIQGKIPSGFFNALFEFSGSWLDDAMDTKYLALDGYFISLYNLHLNSSPLILRDEVKKAVPSKWEPTSLSRFIKKYGTHILVGMAIGGQDVICTRQKHASPIPSTDLKVHLEDLGDRLFSDENNLSPLHAKSRVGNRKVPEIFTKILQTSNLLLDRYSETSSKDGLVIIRSKRGGNTYTNSHNKWLQTVSTSPDATMFKFVPITSLLTGVSGSGYLSHAINLYLRYKPPMEDLQYFLEYQVPQQWAPMFNELALSLHRKQASYPHLQFQFFGPKLHINTTQVLTDWKPVTGLRLYLEGKKYNRLAIHVQHLSVMPSMLTAAAPPWSRWQSNENADVAFLEPIQWKRYARVCTASVTHDPSWLDGSTTSDGVFIVVGAQLSATGTWPGKALHLRLLFKFLPGCAIRTTKWGAAPATHQKSTFLTMLSTTFTQRDQTAPRPEAPQLNSGVYGEGPPVPARARRLLRFIDVTEVTRGPHDVPGHWVVTAARLVKEGQKVGLHVKFALLHYPSQ